MALAAGFINALTSPTAQSAFYAVGTKGVGSVFRTLDARNAPPEMRKATIRQEAVVLALTSVFSIIIHQVADKLFKRFSQLAKHRFLFLAAVTIPSFCLAEAAARLIRPKNYWQNLGDNTQPIQATPVTRRPADDDNFQDDQLKALPQAFQPLHHVAPQPLKPLAHTPLAFQTPVPYSSAPRAHENPFSGNGLNLPLMQAASSPFAGATQNQYYHPFANTFSSRLH